MLVFMYLVLFIPGKQRSWAAGSRSPAITLATKLTNEFLLHIHVLRGKCCLWKFRETPVKLTTWQKGNFVGMAKFRIFQYIPLYYINRRARIVFFFIAYMHTQQRFHSQSLCVNGQGLSYQFVLVWVFVGFCFKKCSTAA